VRLAIDAADALESASDGRLSIAAWLGPFGTLQWPTQDCPARLVCQPQPKGFDGLDEEFAYGAQTLTVCSTGRD